MFSQTMRKYTKCCYKHLHISPNKILYSRTLEPYYILDKDLTDHTVPWTHHLHGKKVLIISPFVETFKNQLDRGFTFFGSTDNRRVWKQNQQFVFYKTFNTLSNNHPHKNWFETFNIMCDDIKKLDFDIALLSCGGYGLPLCDFIYDKLGKSSIYVGGALQLLFGVYGNRWIKDKHPIVTRLINEPNNMWVRPSIAERPNNFNNVEGGCYW